MSVRLPAVAGQFYPGNPAELISVVDGFLSASKARMPTQPKAVILPHAGYIYSGATAAVGYALLEPWREKIKRVVLLGPTHRVGINGLALTEADTFSTPLGNISLDQQSIAALADFPQVIRSDLVHAQEHSLEVHLPFLQRVLGEFSLVPLAVGRVDPALVAEVIDRLWGGDETLIVVSSDLSHFQTYDSAVQTDQATCQQILLAQSNIQPEQACGAFPVNGLLLSAKRHGLRPRLLSLCNSGDTAGDKQRVVGYAAFVFEPEPVLDMGQRLLILARQSIAGKFGQIPAISADSPELDGLGATFVTLTQNGQLRGCIGSLQAYRSLREDIRANSVAAAFNDPRFPQLKADELARTRVEVSLLTPPVPMIFVDESDALAQLKPLEDGVIFSAAGRRSTFLPQVWEQLPTPAVFMSHLKQKAGLAADYWGPDVQLQRYAVKKWKEGE